MFCTTECWSCEDKTCEHYVSKEELYFENKQLEDIRKKAIEYIETNMKWFLAVTGTHTYKLLEILKGGENND